MDEGVTWGCMSSLELHRESPETARTGPLEGWTVVEEIAIEVEANVRLKTLWKTLQDLDRKEREERFQSK